MYSSTPFPSLRLPSPLFASLRLSPPPSPPLSSLIPSPRLPNAINAPPKYASSRRTPQGWKGGERDGACRLCCPRATAFSSSQSSSSGAGRGRSPWSFLKSGLSSGTESNSTFLFWTGRSGLTFLPCLRKVFLDTTFPPQVKHQH